MPSHQPINLITSTSFNLVEQVIKPIELVFQPPISYDIHVKSIPIQLIKITIPPDIFQQHLAKTFFQPEVGEMEIDKMLVRIRVQNLRIMGWTITKKKQLTKINLGSEENLQ
jgi:hypothetical protein